MAGKVETRHEMLRAGYKFLSYGSCKGCGNGIEWWLTTNRKKMPFDNTPGDEYAPITAHWSTCPKRDDFKSTADTKLHTAAARSRAAQYLLDTTGARAVVALYAEGPVVAWINGIPGEDLRDECIAAANKLRWHVQLGKEKQA